MSKNLTKVINHPYLKREAAVYERDDEKLGEHIITRCPGDSREYLAGPIVDRLHEFEKLGYEPEQLKKIIDKYKYLKIIANYQYGAYGTLGDRFEAFRKAYAKEEEFKKLVDERIASAILNSPSKIYMSKVSDFDRPNRNGSVLTWTHMDLNALAKIDKVEHSDEGIRVTARPKIDDPFWAEFAKRNIKPYTMAFELPTGLPGIDKVIFNNPATIVFWKDGTKTVVKAQNGEPYDPEKGLAMAISKRALGNDRTYYDEFNKQLGKGQKHSTPEQFNSEVGNAREYDELWRMYHNEVRHSVAALGALKSIVGDKKATKDQMLAAIKNAINQLKSNDEKESK